MAVQPYLGLLPQRRAPDPRHPHTALGAPLAALIKLGRISSAAVVELRAAVIRDAQGDYLYRFDAPGESASPFMLGKVPRWLARGLLAVGAPIALLLAVEGALRISGYGVSTDLFIPDEKPGFYRTNPHFTAPYFPPQFDITPLNFRIAGKKEVGHLRIFVLGESAVRGTPEPGFGFASQLGAQLRSAYPGRPIEVYNLGIVAINSHVVYQVAKQVLAFHPDLLVVYMGNNEVVGPNGPGSVSISMMPPLPVIRASIWIAGTRTGQLIRQLAGHFAPRGRSLEWKGMSTFDGKTVRADDPRLAAVYRNFESNLRDIVGVAAHAGVKTVLATVVANLKDSPPFASLHRLGMTDTELKAWSKENAGGLNAWELDQADEAARNLTRALQIDPEYAETHFVMGRILAGKGEVDASRAEFLQALHWDALRFRPDPRINDIVRKVALDSKGMAVLVDTSLVLGSDVASRGPPSGREILLEHVHFNWSGNERMALLLGEACGKVLFGADASPMAWLDEHACADAVGFTGVGELRMLTEMQAIRGKPPFTGQLTFGEDQYRYQRELGLVSKMATSTEALAAAATQMDAAVARSPDDTNLELQRAAVAEQSGHHDRELESIERLLVLEPRSSDILAKRARALNALGRGAEAEDAILESLRIDPYNLPSYTALVEILRKTGDFSRGSEVFKAAITRDPASGFIQLTYADLLFFHGDHDVAVDACRSVLAREPGDSDALRRLVSLYTAEGNSREAFELMSSARAAQPLNFENDLALARIYDESGDEDNVAACLSDAARGGPATAQLHLYLARHLSKKGQMKEARLQLARARRLAVLAGDSELIRQIKALFGTLAM
jgi:tetratricopeptide (TPR) repeat protein